MTSKQYDACEVIWGFFFHVFFELMSWIAPSGYPGAGASRALCVCELHSAAAGLC